MTTPLPIRSRGHTLEAISRQHVEQIFARAGWICERPMEDYGVDLESEVVSGGHPTGLKFCIQLKATEHLKVSRGNVVHRCKVSTAHYFLKRPEPVIYVVYDAEGDKAYWLWVQPYLKGLDASKPGWREQKTVQIRISERSRLTKNCIPAIAEHVAAWWEGRATEIGWPSAPAPAGVPFTLPPDLATFTGRDDLLAQLDHLLQPGGTASVAIVGLKGMAGVGKSALVIHAAHTWRERFPDGVVWVDLRAEKDPCQALRHVAGVYGFREDAAKLGEDRQALVALYRTLLHGKRSLLILDNAEGLSAKDLDCLLPGVEGPVTVITSRKEFAALNRLGKRLQVDVMGMEEALALLARLVGAELLRPEHRGEPVEPPVEGVERDYDDYTKLVERLGRLPLALDIAGRRMADRGWGPGEMMRRLEGARDLPAFLALPVAEKPEESVALAFALSYDGLGAEEQELFRALGAFAPAGFTARVVAEVFSGERREKRGEEEAETTLERLEALSLVRRAEPTTEAQPEPVEGRYDLHPLVRDYTQALSGQAGEADRWAERHARYFLTLAGWGHDQLGNPETALAAVGTAAVERGNLLAAQEACLRLGLGEETVGLAYDLNELFTRSGHWADRRTVLKAGIKAAREGGKRRDEARLAHNLGALAQDQGDYPEARRLYQEAAETFEELGARREQATVLHQLGTLAQDQGDYPEAHRLYQESLDIKQQLGDHPGVALTQWGLGNIAQAQGDYEEAERQWPAALDTFRELSDRKSEAGVLHQLGILAQLQGDYPEARRLYQESLEIKQQLGDKSGEQKTLHQLGMLARTTGKMQEARDLNEASYRMAVELGNRQEEAILLHELGRLAEEDGDLTEADRLFAESLDTFEELRSPNAEIARRSLERVRKGIR